MRCDVLEAAFDCEALTRTLTGVEGGPTSGQP
jgi:hypothetical protein